MGGSGRRATHPGPFVGRRDELGALRAEARRAFAGTGEPRVVVVEGDGGMGKTSLVNELARQLIAAVWLWSSGEASEQNLSWGVVASLLTELDLQQRRRSAARPPLPGADPLAVGSGLVPRLASLAADGPVVLVLDDLHWSDPPSAAALLFALRRLSAMPMLTLAVVRPPFPGDLGDGWRRLVSSKGRRLRLGGLVDDELVELAAGLGQKLSERAVARVRRHTGGNPMWATAVFNELPTDELEHGTGSLPVPRDISSTILARQAGLSRHARSFVVAGAVLGHEFSSTVAATLAGVNDPLAAVQELVDAGLLEELVASPVDGPRMRFAHDLVHAAIYRDLGPAQRARLHGEAVQLTFGAEALGHLAASTLAPSEAVAAELEAAGVEEAGTWRMALAQLHLDAAVRLSPPGRNRERRLYAAMEVHLAAGEPARARAYIEEVSSLEPEPVPRRDYVLGCLARCEGRFARAHDLLERAWEALSSDDDPELAAQVAVELAFLAVVRMSPDEAVRFSRRALEASAPRAPAAQLARGVELVGLTLGGGGVAALQSAGIAMASGTELPVLIGRGIAKLWTDDLEGAYEDLSVAVTRLEAGEVLGRMAPLAFLADACFRLVRMTEASVHAELACDIVEAAERYWDCAIVHTRAGYAAAAMGDFSRANAHAEAIGAMASRVGDRDEALSRVRASVASASGVAIAIAIARDDPAALLEAAGPATALNGPSEPGSFALGPVLAEALVLTGSLEEAEAALAPYEERAHALGRRSAMAGSARVRGTLASARGDRVGACTSFDAAIHHARRLPLELGRCHLAYGRAMLDAGDVDASREQLDAARAIFAGGGALAFVRLADSVLSGLGAVISVTGRQALTPAEVAVAGLAGQRLSNPEIADRLSVSRKTVEYHLSHIYEKLGVRNRGELARLVVGSLPKR